MIMVASFLNQGVEQANKYILHLADLVEEQKGWEEMQEVDW